MWNIEDSERKALSILQESIHIKSHTGLFSIFYRPGNETRAGSPAAISRNVRNVFVPDIGRKISFQSFSAARLGKYDQKYEVSNNSPTLLCPFTEIVEKEGRSLDMMWRKITPAELRAPGFTKYANRRSEKHEGIMMKHSLVN